MSQKTHAKLYTAFLFAAAALAAVPLLHAATVVNINTADKAALTTLSGIGEVKAQAIIDYRTANGPFVAVEEIMDVSGIGTATFNAIKDFITVGGESAPPPQTQTQTQTETQTQTQTQPQTVPPGPPALTVRITAESRSLAGGGSYFSAQAFGTQDVPLSGARYIWNFGDGTTAEGARVLHAFSYPGKYSVSVSAGYNYSSGFDRMVVEAVSAAVSLEVESDGSLLVSNNSPTDLNIGLWSLTDGQKSYSIPEGTIILAHEGVRFSPAITGLSGTPSAALYYPNSTQAAAASVAMDSPLRGERVTQTKLAAPAAPAADTQLPAKTAPAAPIEPRGGEVLGQSSSLPSEEPSGALWGSVAGLVAVLAAGGAGAYYLRRPALVPGTSASVDEFEIE